VFCAPERRAGGIEMNAIARLVKDDSGQDMLEYALLTALIALAAVVAVKAAGLQVSAIFDKIKTELTT
jgi:Flp pilus assembly pilin Flp